MGTYKQNLDIARKYIGFILIALLYAKFVTIMLFKSTNLVLDVATYFSLFMSILIMPIRKEVVWLMIICFISFVNGGARNIFLIFASTYVLNVYNYKSVASINIFFQLVLLLFVIIALQTNLLKESQFIPTMAFDFRERWDFGFGNPNTFALFIYSLIINIYIVSQYKNYFLFLPIFLLVSILVSNYTGSRTFLFVIIFFLTSSLFLRINKVWILMLKYKYVLYIVPFVIIITLFILIHNISQYNELNYLLSGRLGLYHSLFGSVGLKEILIGTPAVNEELIDNGYVHLLLESGILSLVIFLYLYVSYIRNLNERNIFVLPIIFSMLLYAITESIFTAVLYFGNMIIWTLLYGSFYQSKQKHIKS